MNEHLKHGLLDEAQEVKHAYRLVNGVFDPSQATEVLLTLIEDKIRFHQRKNLTSRERNGHPDATSTRRIGELRVTRDALLDLIAEADASGQQLVINCTIEASLAASNEIASP